MSKYAQDTEVEIRRCPECQLLGAHHHTCSQPGLSLVATSAQAFTPMQALTKKSYHLRTVSLTTKRMLLLLGAFAGATLAKAGFDLQNSTAGSDQLFGWAVALVGIAVAAASGTGAWRMRLQLQKLRNDFDQGFGLTESSAFILYLRSFQHDETSGPVYTPDLLPFHQTTNEELLVKDLTRQQWWGRFRILAVGKPNEELPPLGCTRYRLGNDEWKREVEKLIRKASAVLLRPDITPAVMWETEKLLFHLPPQRVYILARPYGDSGAKGYARWSNQMQNLFPHPLPDVDDAGFLVGFDDGWKPTHSAVNEDPRLQRLAARAVAPSVGWMLTRVSKIPPPLPT